MVWKRTRSMPLPPFILWSSYSPQRTTAFSLTYLHTRSTSFGLQLQPSLRHPITFCGHENNVFVKPDDQNDACIGFGMARKGRIKSNVINHKSAESPDIMGTERCIIGKKKRFLLPIRKTSCFLSLLECNTWRIHPHQEILAS